MRPDERMAKIQTDALAMLAESDPILAAAFSDRERQVLDLGILLGATAALQQVADQAEERIASGVDWDAVSRELQEGA